jgi:hypothetical protein
MMAPVQPVNSCSNLIEGYLAGTFEWPPCELKIFNANSRHREMRIPRQSFDKYSEYRCLVSLFSSCSLYFSECALSQIFRVNHVNQT